jgi:pantetheine-phosphate adenylyltransferase
MLFDKILDKYDESHRHYHNFEHIFRLFELYFEKYNANINNDICDAIVFHDIIYDPFSSTNEFDSAEFYKANIDNFNQDVYDAILSTKDHKPVNSISEILIKLDLHDLLYGDMRTLIENEYKIFKEYQFVDLKIYNEERCRILRNLGNTKNIEFLTGYIENRKVNIGVYAGSFNPFHKGHENILKKAECIFDKVIIAKGKNTAKNTNIYDLPDALKYHQKIEFDGLLTDMINDLQYDVTLVRGLRNSTDLQYEQNQYHFLKDMKPNIKIVNIFCDKEYEHISSSAIRSLEPFGKDKVYLL